MARTKFNPYENFCKFTYSVPKECLPLLGKLEKKGPSPVGRWGNKGLLIFKALYFLDIHTPYGWEYQKGAEILPNGPPPNSPKKFESKNSRLRLVPLSTDEQGA